MVLDEDHRNYFKDEIVLTRIKPMRMVAMQSATINMESYSLPSSPKRNFSVLVVSQLIVQSFGCNAKCYCKYGTLFSSRQS